MDTRSPPSTIKTWQYTSTQGGIEKNLKINPSATLPTPKPEQHLVQVIALALNPIDYKPAELPVVGWLMAPRPATPGLDFAGRVITPAAGSSIKRGQLVFGLSGTSPMAGGGLSEFTISAKDSIVPLPDGLSLIDAATIGVAGLTAYQSIVPRVKKGDKIFINGGSGGTGIFGIQIAKVVGCHVTTTCSTANVELCKSLGADEVVDYRKTNVVEALKASGHKFDHVVDNVGTDPALFWRLQEYTKPDAAYVMVGREFSLKSVSEGMKIRLWPGFLGGTKRKREGFWPKPNYDHLEQIGMWMNEGKVRAVVDHKFTFEQAPEAFAKLRTKRARGKIVIDVASEKYMKAWTDW